MNDTITQARSLDQDRRDIDTTDARTPLADRLSIRIALWLLLRAEHRIDRERQVNLHGRHLVSQRARQAHELAVARAWQSGVRIY